MLVKMQRKKGGRSSEVNMQYLKDRFSWAFLSFFFLIQELQLTALQLVFFLRYPRTIASLDHSKHSINILTTKK